MYLIDFITWLLLAIWSCCRSSSGCTNCVRTWWSTRSAGMKTVWRNCWLRRNRCTRCRGNWSSWFPSWRKRPNTIPSCSIIFRRIRRRPTIRGWCAKQRRRRPISRGPKPTVWRRVVNPISRKCFHFWRRPAKL